jgi:hypothetical protein
MKRAKTHRRKKSNHLISDEVVGKCHRSRRSSSWITATSYCHEYAQFIASLKGLSGFVDDLSACGVRSAVEIINHKPSSSGEEVMDEIERTINKEAQREYKRRGREFPTDHSRFPDKMDILHSPDSLLETEANLQAVEYILTSAMAHLRKHHPKYYVIIKDLYITSPAPPKFNPSVYAVRRALREFRSSLLTVLEQVSSDDENYEILNRLKEFASDEVGRGAESFRKFLEDMFAEDVGKSVG